MKTELKYVIHFYLGCECLDEVNVIWKIVGVYQDCLYVENNYNAGAYEKNFDEVKPILRKLEDMTFDEHKEYNHRKQRKGYMTQIHADNTLWLCKIGVDVFNLIENGFAIRKTEANQSIDKNEWK